MRRFDPRWFGLALIAYASSSWSDFVLRSQFDFAMTLGTGGLGLAAFVAADQRKWRSLALGLAVVFGALALQVLLSSFVVRQATVSALSYPAAWLLSWVQEATVTPGGAVSFTSHEGQLLFAASFELYALVPMLTFLAAGLFVLWFEPRSGANASTLFGVVFVATLCRAVFVMLRFADGDEVLMQEPSRTAMYADPWEILGTLLVVAAFAGWAVRRHRASQGRTERLSLPACAAALAVVFVGGLGVSFAANHHPSRGEKAGRVLVDDRFSGQWEPASRRLTNDWFGDFSTYSFSSAVEWLGYHFAMTVNPSKSYTDELLANYDTVVIKTPSERIPKPEREALLRFVERGGGLLLIGDHTNLLGMGTRLNQLSRHAGITFRFDSVMDASTGYFSVYRGPLLGTHPAASRVDRMQFMTGCSLEVTGDAEPIMVVPHQVRQAHDYASNSFFGSIHSDPSLPASPLVLAAVGQYGDGKIVAFSDSTVLSSFALFEWDRERFLLGMLAELNAGAARFGWVRLLIVGAAFLSLLFGVALCWRIAGKEWLLAAVLGGAPGLIAGLALAEGGADTSLIHPPPWREAPTLSIWIKDTEAMYFPVLGQLPKNADLDSSYDTMLAAIPRSGVFPRFQTEVDEVVKGKALMVLNPRGGISVAQAERLKAWVEDGATLIVATKRTHVHPDALQTYLAPFGITYRYERQQHFVGGPEVMPSPSKEINLFRMPVGKGRVVFVVGTEWWSRKRLAHAFFVPGATRRSHYAALAELLLLAEDLLPSHRRSYRVLPPN